MIVKENVENEMDFVSRNGENFSENASWTHYKCDIKGILSSTFEGGKLSNLNILVWLLMWKSTKEFGRSSGLKYWALKTISNWLGVHEGGMDAIYRQLWWKSVPYCILKLYYILY